MSFLSGIPQLAALVAQPAVLAAGVAAGIAVGTIGVATGAIPVTDAGPAARLTALYECPGSGRVVASLASDQNVLVTARSADGTWLQLYIGQLGAERAWAPAGALQLEAAPDTLPVADCEPAATAEPTGLQPPSFPPTVAPSETLVPSAEPSAAGTPTPRPSATVASTPTPKPTATPFTGPFLSDLLIYDVPQSLEGVYYINQPPCGGTWTIAPFNVEATDPDGMGSVDLYFQPTNGAVQPPVSMTYEGSSPDRNGQYNGSFGSDGYWDFGPVAYWVVGTDKLGNTATLYPGSDQPVELIACSD
jgi:hypothetical protein